MKDVVRLTRPIPSEAVFQMQRHLTFITPERGYNLRIQKNAVPIVPESMEQSNISGDKAVVVNIAWNIDSLVDNMANEVDTYMSTATLECFMLENADPQTKTAQLFADIIRYFYDQSGDERWTLFTENKNQVVHQIKFLHLYRDIDYTKKPIFKVNIECQIRWGCRRTDLYFPA